MSVTSPTFMLLPPDVLVDEVDVLEELDVLAGVELAEVELELDGVLEAPAALLLLLLLLPHAVSTPASTTAASTMSPQRLIHPFTTSPFIRTESATINLSEDEGQFRLTWSSRMRRATVIVMDACGVGALPDAAEYAGDVGSNTLVHLAEQVGGLTLPTLERLGLGSIVPILGVPPAAEPALHGRLRPLGPGKESGTGHWELMGVIPERALP